MAHNDQLLDREFFMGNPMNCARGLIGCRFEWRGCAGVIVETEAYEAEGDEACHTHARPSARRFVDEHEAGTAYVYLNYGVHWLFNLLVKGGARSGFVLFRALEPVAGLARMKSRRKREKEHELCSGPGKLTQALGIDGRLHGTDVLGSEHCRMTAAVGEAEPRACPRIGITKACDRKWRYLRVGSPALSVPPK
ncbi:MAG: DNA-3-methyladenine glycosylase [Akkermansiaceae bacterium]